MNRATTECVAPFGDSLLCIKSNSRTSHSPNCWSSQSPTRYRSRARPIVRCGRNARSSFCPVACSTAACRIFNFSTSPVIPTQITRAFRRDGKPPTPSARNRSGCISPCKAALSRSTSALDTFPRNCNVRWICSSSVQRTPSPLIPFRNFTIARTTSGATGSAMKARNESLTVIIIPLQAVSAKLCIILFCGVISLRADPPAGYYQTALNKSGFALRDALHNIINDHTVIPYSSSSFDTSDALRLLDQDPQNPANVFLIYVQRSQPTNTFGQNTGWNREHLWPNSYGLDDREPAYSDLHNLRAEDLTVNAERANKYFDTSDTSSPTYRFPAHAEVAQCSTDSDSWEPPAHVKGDIARAMFYMDVRYEGDRANESQLRLTDAISTITATDANMGKLSTLLRWHDSDPVDAPERLRNDRICDLYQRNRNPFIDHPEWVRLVFRPQLFIARGPNQIQLTWDPRWSNATVQASANLRDWSALSGATIPTTNALRFFRLLVP